jgi:CRISPR/Cas system endoribonuclease Cas6 (RAMP superfamily)
VANHLLAVENSPRTRQAVADTFQRYIYDFFPFPPDLMQAAAARVAQYGGSQLRPPMGPRTATLARVIGWRTVWRLKHFLGR